MKRKSREDLFSGSHKDEGTHPWYVKAFEACTVREGSEGRVKRAVDLVSAGFYRYYNVCKAMGAENPQNAAYVLGVIHYKEASCEFDRVLHNGEKIIGTTKKTTLVPKGRGPFISWEQAARDAIYMQETKWKRIFSNADDIGAILYALERYNGTGYLTGAGRAETTPYLWACSNINSGKGLYVADGKFDPVKTTLLHVGAAVILKEFWQLGVFKVKTLKA